MEGTKAKGAARLKGSPFLQVIQRPCGAVRDYGLTAFQPLRAFFACTLAGLERLTMRAVILVPAGGTGVKLSSIAVGRAALRDCPGGLWVFAVPLGTIIV